MNCEIFLYDLQSAIFWASIGEISLFLLGFVLFCSSPGRMGFIWLHVFHLGRGFIGFFLINKLPTSHEIVARIQVPETPDGSHYSLDKLYEGIKRDVSEVFLEYTHNLKQPLLIYGLFTSVCVIVDLIEFLIQFIRFGYRGTEH
jgi:hypothetical protein